MSAGWDEPTARGRMDSSPTYIFGLDLGQVNDFTALTINQLIERPDGELDHQTQHLQRWRGVKYPVVVREVAGLITAVRNRPLPLTAFRDRGYRDRTPRVVLAIDHSGVGRPVVDLFVEAELDCQIVPVTITAGSVVTRSDDGFERRVPKRVLVSTVQILLQTERLKIQRTLSLAETLRSELLNFRAKISAAGNDSYGAGDDWREGNNDDLVLAEALAAWVGENGIGMDVIEFASPLVAAELSRLGL